jgi:hypothetical protein
MRKAVFGVLLDRAIKYDKMISSDPPRDKNEHMHVINAMTKALPSSIFHKAKGHCLWKLCWTIGIWIFQVVESTGICSTKSAHKRQHSMNIPIIKYLWLEKEWPQLDDVGYQSIKAKKDVVLFGWPWSWLTEFPSFFREKVAARAPVGDFVHHWRSDITLFDDMLVRRSIPLHDICRGPVWFTYPYVRLIFLAVYYCKVWIASFIAISSLSHSHIMHYISPLCKFTEFSNVTFLGKKTDTIIDWFNC